MTKKIDSSGSCEKERIRDEIDEQIREYLRKGGRIQVLSRPGTDMDTNRGCVWQSTFDDTELGI